MEEESGEVVRVVKETWEAVRAENAVEGTSSFAASHAAPLLGWSELLYVRSTRIEDVHGPRVGSHCAEVGCELDGMLRSE